MSFNTVNPFNNDTIKTYSFDSKDVLTKKINKSHEAYKKWGSLTLEMRIQAIENFNTLLKNQKNEAARRISLEMGKPLAESLAEVTKCSKMIEYYCKHVDHFLSSKNISSDFPNSSIHYCSQGVIFGVMPWNFPFWQALRFAIPTLLVGNTVLIKHAPNVQGCQDFIQNLANKAFNDLNPIETLIIDIPQIESVISNPFVRGVSFTGSELAGKSIAQVSAKYLKKVVLELGGSDAYIVLDDADLELAAEACVRSRFLNCGQSCVAAKRWIVDKSVYEEFLTITKEKMNLLKAGNPLEEKTNLGPMARIDLKRKLIEQVKQSIDQGAVISFGSLTQDDPQSCFLSPLLLTNVAEQQPLFNEEIFGPVASITIADSKEHAISLANNTKYGLGGAIFSKDTQAAAQIAINDLDTGGVFINDFYKSGPELPFGGVKSSGIGRELSYLALYEFANIKTLSIKTD